MPDLEDRLRELGGRLDVPPAPDVGPAVLRRIEQPSRTRFSILRYALAGLVVLVVGFAGLVAASPEVRAALADLLRFAGIVVQQTPESAPTPTAPDTAPPTQERVSGLAEASRRVGIQVRSPASLGQPDEVYVIDDRVAGLVYRREGIRIEQFDGHLDPVFAKTVRQQPEWVDLDGQDALWFDRPHELGYIDRDGKRHRASARLAGNTLIWQPGTTTFRLEGDLDRGAALAIARSLE